MLNNHSEKIKRCTITTVEILSSAINTLIISTFDVNSYVLSFYPISLKRKIKHCTDKQNIIFSCKIDAADNDLNDFVFLSGFLVYISPCNIFPLLQHILVPQLVQRRSKQDRYWIRIYRRYQLGLCRHSASFWLIVAGQRPVCCYTPDNYSNNGEAS